MVSSLKQRRPITSWLRQTLSMKLYLWKSSSIKRWPRRSLLAKSRTLISFSHKVNISSWLLTRSKSWVWKTLTLPLWWPFSRSNAARKVNRIRPYSISHAHIRLPLRCWMESLTTRSSSVYWVAKLRLLFAKRNIRKPLISIPSLRLLPKRSTGLIKLWSSNCAWENSRYTARWRGKSLWLRTISKSSERSSTRFISHLTKQKIWAAYGSFLSLSWCLATSSWLVQRRSRRFTMITRERSSLKALRIPQLTLLLRWCLFNRSRTLWQLRNTLRKSLSWMINMRRRLRERVWSVSTSGSIRSGRFSKCSKILTSPSVWHSLWFKTFSITLRGTNWMRLS